MSKLPSQTEDTYVALVNPKQALGYHVESLSEFSQRLTVSDWVPVKIGSEKECDNYIEKLIK